jgi:hypothetical protein
VPFGTIAGHEDVRRPVPPTALESVSESSLAQADTNSPRAVCGQHFPPSVLYANDRDCRGELAQNVICCTAMPYPLPRQSGLAPAILVATEKFKSLPGRNVEHSRASITPIGRSNHARKEKTGAGGNPSEGQGIGDNRPPKARQAAEQSLSDVEFPIVGNGEHC